MDPLGSVQLHQNTRTVYSMLVYKYLFWVTHIFLLFETRFYYSNPEGVKLKHNFTELFLIDLQESSSNFVKRGEESNADNTREAGYKK